ncbi:MAG: lamin tail domain-containing protein [Rikenellaceae bacterium]|nr:lamin tail domain-containing protein [Rikenellaceae bacterium]
MKKSLFLGLFLLLAAAGFAQNIRDVRINEILVKNVDNYEDDYGKRIGWIELYNSGHAKVNLGGAYLTVKRGDKTLTYRIPKGDARTVLGPQDYMIFFCDGSATKGVFHTNFTLDQTGYIALLDASGKGTAIDSVMYNVADQEPDISMGRIEDADGKIVFTKLKMTTPRATNELEEKVPHHELFRQMDPSGVGMAITAMSVVFTALLCLYLIFRTLGKISVGIARRKEIRSKASQGAAPAVAARKGDALTSDEIAAIGLALYQYENDLHDIESTVLTFNRTAKAYSPWSSKIYGLRQLPNKK